MMFVGPGWLNRRGRWEAPYELLAQSYSDGMAYYGKLKKEGKLLDLTMAEFADFYRDCHPDYNRGECALWKDILYGSGKEYFWYADPYMRTCLDFNQGGAIIDMRPYAARIPQRTGIGTENVYDASYPYLIQINYRAGYFTHYAGAGTVKSCRVTFRGETADLCLCRTMATYEKTETGVRLTADPVTLKLGGADVVVQSVFEIEEGTGRIVTHRNLLSDLGGEAVTFQEYFTGGFGTTEYQQDMTDLTLGVDDKTMAYSYHGKRLEKDQAQKAYVTIPQVLTTVAMGGDNDTAWVEEGIAFSPVYHIALTKTIQKGGVRTWLSLQKAN